MARKIWTCLFAIALCLSLSFSGSQFLFGKDADLTPEQVVEAHLKSIASPEVLAKIKNRGIGGAAKVSFIQGGTGNMIGSSLIVAEGSDLAIILKYGTNDYPGEHFAYDGSEVTVGNITPGNRSPLGDFIYRHGGIMKEGLLGGVYSLGWPLLDLSKKNPTLKYSRDKVDGKELHVLQYIAKSGMNDVKVKLFFDPETYRHVRTEYRLVVQGEQALQAGQTFTRGSKTENVTTRDAGILDAVSDSIYLLVEEFGNFKTLRSGKGADAKILTLPISYKLSYSVQGHGSTFLANWNVDASQFYQNGKIDPSNFKVQ